ncbi:hypothetical protein F442_07146 [Phytophthora nicotianae P10297]|uniref:Transposase Tc1-like domain-containing protein n=1 Tax=Phytophthora nicotianae P10297 TaxID=1317064 RepID=W2ZGW6_PHYNI|nr:hypothetical protein F442_07146 [Phytophthora nicotianae P10297]
MGNLTDVQRRAIVNDLLFSCRDGKVPHGTCLAKDYGCHWHSIKRIWNRYRENVALGIADGAPESRIKGNLGRKPYDRSELAAKLKEVPIFECHRVAATTARIGVSASLIRALLDEGHLTRRLRRIKPLLSDDNKIQRMKHTLTFIDEQTYQFENIYDYHRKAMFNGKLGIWPIVEDCTAQRNSANSPAGTVLTRNIASINRDVIKEFLLKEVIPSVARMRPRQAHSDSAR